MGRVAARARVLALGLGLAAGGLAPVGCASHRPRTGTTHVVASGETLYQIAKRYGVSVDDLVRSNRIEDPRRVAVGTRLWIPTEAERAAPEATAGGCPLAPESVRRQAQEEAKDDGDIAFEWPARGTVTTCFQGPNAGRGHEGLDIAASAGTPVRAAEAGKVIYSSVLGAYGKVVIVKHAGRFSSVYAHNSRNLVEEGAFVEKGEEIAEVGETGNATGPHVHFEIRKSRKPDDPLLYLP